MFVAPVTSVGGFTDPVLRRRQDSREDLINALREGDGLTVVESADLADLTLMVESSAVEETGQLMTETTPSLNLTTTRPETSPTVRVRLTVGDYEYDIKGTTTSIRWRDAAGDAARQVRQWINENRTQLLANRP